VAFEDILCVLYAIDGGFMLTPLKVTVLDYIPKMESGAYITILSVAPINF
jgi:hypothetical protein